MKADKPLEWFPRRDSPNQWQANTEFHGSFEHYQVIPAMDGNGWIVGGVGNESRVATLDDGKQRCQDDYNRKCRLKAWEDYMITHDPPRDAFDS